MDDSEHAAYYTPAGSPVTHERKRMTSMESNALSSQSSTFDTEPKQLTPILKKRDLQSSSSVRFRQDSDDSDADIEDSQRWTPPTVRRRGSHVDTPHPEVRHRVDTSSDRGRRRSKESRRTDCDDDDTPKGTRCRARSHVVSSPDSSSDSDSYIPASQPKHFTKAPKFDGTNITFVAFYAQFQNCVKYNCWNKSEQLAFLKSALTGNAGQVLWDSELPTRSVN